MPRGSPKFSILANGCITVTESTGVQLVAKYVSNDLVCIVEVEGGRSKVGGAKELTPVAVRVSSVFRFERGAWKLVQHADPITTPDPADSVANR